MEKYWYAVEIDEEDNDWGFGSYDLEEAKEMAKKYKNGQIAVIKENNDPICIKIIKQKDF